MLVKHVLLLAQGLILLELPQVLQVLLVLLLQVVLIEVWAVSHGTCEVATLIVPRGERLIDI